MIEINRTSLLLAFVVASLAIPLASSAQPGSRSGSATWYYDGKLWMFGGDGMDSTNRSTHPLSDLWSYNPTTNQWRYETGDTGLIVIDPPIDSTPVYPGKRKYACSWVESNTLWLFGGYDHTSGGFPDNNVWRYDPSTNQWTIVYLATSLTSSYTTPYRIGPRYSHACVLSSDGKTVYVNGGTGYDSTNSNTVALNDLWSYSIETNTWTFITGNTTGNSTSVPSGTLTAGVSTSTTAGYPIFGDRMGGWTVNSDLYFVTARPDWTSRNQLLRYSTDDTWTLYCPGEMTGRRNSGAAGNNDKYWLFGGYGTDINGNLGHLADLHVRDGTDWKYVIGSRVRDTSSSFPVQPGLGDSSTFPAGRESSMMWMDDDGNLWLFGGSNNYGTFNDLWKFAVSTEVWTWYGGGTSSNQVGNYTNDPVPPIAPVTAPVAAPADSIPPMIESPLSRSSSNVTDPSNGLSTDAKIAIGVVVPVVVIGVGLLVLLLLLKKRKKQRAKKVTTSVPLTPVPDKDAKYDAIQPKPSGVYSHIGGLDTNSSTATSTQALDSPVTDSRMIPYSAITLDQEIGEGSFGKVYLGKLRTTKVAIKVANTKMSQDEFIREANFQLAIPPHPNIVQLLGISINGPQPLVVLEYCNEGSLDTILFKTNKLRTPAEQIGLAEAIARGIDHLHQNNIVHRDLAIRNILLHKGEPKISDFGMSRKLKEVSQVGKTAATIGPLRWMAPEALGKQLYSTKSDVWSFGMILYEIVAHEEPHANEDLISVAIKIRDEGFVPTIPSDCPPVLREVMQMCWKVNPDERPDMNKICTVLESSAISSN